MSSSTIRIKTKGEYCCDFETTSKNQYLKEGLTRVYLFRLVDLKTGLDVKQGTSMSEFINNIENDKKIEKIYFHNLSFDGCFIIDYLLRNDYKYVNDKEQLSKENCDSFYSIIDESGSIYEIDIYFSKVNKKVKINCSYKLTGLSIEDLGELVGVTKLKETHDYTEFKNYNSISEVTEEELNYIKNDVEIMRLGILKCYEMGIRGLTKSSACYKMWKHMEWNKICKDVHTDYPPEIKHIVDASYRGGITMINKKYKGKLLGECRNYDVNSLYPSVMYNDMPIGEYVSAKNDKDIPSNYNIRLYEISVFNAKVLKGFIPFIPTSKSFIFKDSYQYTNEIKNMTLYLWDCEYELFKTFYEGTYKVVNIVAWKSKKDLFKDYIDKFKKIKEEAPNPSPERTFAKLCMNSLYGKFAQTSDRVSKRPMLLGNGVVYYERFISNLKSNYDRKIASRITSLARCVLIKAIESEPNRFIYCDTDSIYCLGDYELKGIPIDSKKLGYWKYEYSYSKFKGLKAKCYIATISNEGEKKGTLHSAVAGLSKECQKQLNYDNFKEGLTIEGAKKQVKRVKGGMIIDTIPFTIKVEKQGVITSGKE